MVSKGMQLLGWDGGRVTKQINRQCTFFPCNTHGNLLYNTGKIQEILWVLLNYSLANVFVCLSSQMTVDLERKVDSIKAQKSRIVTISDSVHAIKDKFTNIKKG
jgi:hypothetical protein